MQAAESFLIQWRIQFSSDKNTNLEQGTKQQLKDKKIITKELGRKIQPTGNNP